MPKLVSRGGNADVSGFVRAGGGDDTVTSLLEALGTGSYNARLEGAAGLDVLDIELKGLISGSPMILAGDGNDLLKLVADQPGLATPTLNGGPGFDEGIGFGTFISVEKIN